MEYAKHAGLRARKDPSPGERAGIFAEPGPQQSDRSLRRSAGDKPADPRPALSGWFGRRGLDISRLPRTVCAGCEEEG